ncbi:protein kinase domain-containing protein [Halonatronum saccharophilum]|uniref:protein kinase domain-containing protein n=1 Tax=Halonatronum saccharophilum TaxID=150060 RepID=UPI000487D5A0|nr:protein kinase [Halonatronum saccharophilum]
MTTTRLKDYELTLKPIGRGQFARVHLAYDLKRKCKVAIKSSSHIKTAKKEATVMSKYGSHPFLPQFYDFFIVDDRAYIIMEYFPAKKIGRSNHNSTAKKRSEEDATRITLNILQGLKHLHQSGFAHNDIWPKNILIMDDNPNKIKLIDFGLSRPLNTRKGMKSKTKDLLRVALTCIYLVDNPLLEEPLQNLKKLKDNSLKKVLYKGIHPNEDNRYQSTEEFIDNLKEIT